MSTEMVGFTIAGQLETPRMPIRDTVLVSPCSRLALIVLARHPT